MFRLAVKNKVLSFFLGVNSGAVFSFNVALYTAYLYDMGSDIESIGFFAITILPYSLKYLWAPIFDKYKAPFLPTSLGLRKSWIIITQILLIIVILSMSILSRNDNYIKNIFIASLFTSFLGASFDIVSQALRIEISNANDDINFLNVFGFRVGLVLIGGLALYLSSLVSWCFVFIFIAFLLSIFLIIISTYISANIPNYSSIFTNETISQKLYYMFIQPLKSILDRKYWLILILIIVSYKLSDGYLDRMLYPYLMDLGYNKQSISSIRIIEVSAAIFGTWFGSQALKKYNLLYCLLFAEIFAAITNLLFLILLSKSSISNLLMLSFLENFATGICNIILIHFMTILCNKEYNATHFAIFSSLSSIAKTFISTSAGYVVYSFSWGKFFYISSLLSIPSIICIIYIIYKARQGTIRFENNYLQS